MTGRNTSTRKVTFEHEIVPTAEDKGLKMTITVTAYDNGMVAVDGRPINAAEDGYDAGHGWLGAAEHVTLKFGELRRQAVARQRSRAEAVTP